ncbi:MAG: hypothetical protein HN390_08900 [Anaerolineae bacterium]|jgi:flavodoxin/ferredoxin|nr:hypothetical protein [Anaerolineae bacterium]MBT7075931.1 hypothetical protein [Anaerolineae bacterium]MBT7991733.1 hypothetical protein [Anaerolineae bacterium]
MKIAIRYYSGAGNTKFVAKKITKALKQNSHRVSSVKVSEESNREGIDDDFDVLGIGFPIYFREAPELLFDLLKRMEGKKRPVFFFTTKGLYSGDAMKNIMAFSVDQNFSPVSFAEFFMPGTDFLILFAKKDSLMERVLKRIHSRDIDKKVAELIRKVEGALPAKTPRQKWYTDFDERVVKYFENKYDNHHRAYIGQFHSNPETCIECMKCVNGCPRHNIVLDGHIDFGESCDVCFNCIHNCPTDAIDIGKITAGNVRYKKVELL